MPDISIKVKNIRGELLRWMDLPMIDPLDKDNFLSIDKTRSYIDTKGPSLEELVINLPAVKEDTIMKKRLAKGKDKDKGRIFDRSKVRMELICDGCNAHQCVYSNKMVGGKGGPEKLTWRSFSDGQREGTCVVPRYQVKSFMFRGNCFVVTILSHDSTITWVGRKQRIVATATD